jgi:hypothetical protein
MQAMDEFFLIQDKVEELITGKKNREQAACERRLRQIQARREKKSAKQESCPQPRLTQTESNNHRKDV